MKIAIFTDSYWPAVNGVSFVTDILHDSMEKLGHQAVIIAPKAKDQKINRKAILLPSISARLMLKDLRITLPIRNKIKNKLKSEKFDAILILTPTQVGILGANYANSNHIPLIYQHSTDIYSYANKYPFVAGLSAILIPNLKPKLNQLRIIKKLKRETIAQFIVRIIITLIFKKSDLIIALSPKIKKNIEKISNTKTRTIVIPTGVDELQFSQSEMEKLKLKLKLVNDDKIIMSVGRIAAEKNLDILIPSFDLIAAKNRNAKLVIVGRDYQYRPRLEKLANRSKYKDRIIFAGAVKHDQLGNYYQLADVFVFPSLTDTQGLVLQEAALAGLPIVMIDRELSSFFTDQKTGFYSDNTSRSLAENILKIINLSPAKYDKMSKASKLAALKLTELKQTQKLMKSIQDIKR